MKKTKAQLQAKLDAANKRCADLADALAKALIAQPVYVPYVVPYTPPSPQFDGPGIYPSPLAPPLPWVITCSNTDKVTS